MMRPSLLRHGRRALARECARLPPRRFTQTGAAATVNSHGNDDNVSNSINGSVAKGTAALRPWETPQYDADEVRRAWEFYEHQRTLTHKIGSYVEPHYKPRDLLNKPPRPSDITLELLLASQAHLGHRTSLWHPANAKYIFGVRGDQDPIHIISLDATAAHLRRACKVVRAVTERAGLVLFVGSRDGHAQAVVKAARLARGCHLFTKWIPGTITNGEQILGKCDKKVVDELDGEVPGFDQQLHHKAVLKPDLVVCLNPMENYVLLHECALHNIPTIGIVDTDCNPTWVTYPIPANDDSLRCVYVIVGALGRAGQEGQEIRLEEARQGQIHYRFEHGLQPPNLEEEVERKDGNADAEKARLESYFEDDEAGMVPQQLQQGSQTEAAADSPDVDRSLIGNPSEAIMSEEAGHDLERT